MNSIVTYVESLLVLGAGVACMPGGYVDGPVPPVCDKGWKLDYMQDHSTNTHKVKVLLLTKHVFISQM